MCVPTTLPFFFEHTSGAGTKYGDGASGVFLITDHAYRSQSQVHLQSGGRSIARRNGLVRFGATATHYDYRNDPQNHPTNSLEFIWNWDFASATGTNLETIPPASLTVLGRGLHTNNAAYSSLTPCSSKAHLPCSTP